MTTQWVIAPDWSGQTVAILASGPSMSQSVANSLRQHRTIAINHTLRLAPWADMFLALDAKHALWAEAQGFTGMRVCGVATPDIDALHPGSMFERVSVGKLHNVEIRNSGLAAIRVAQRMGASRIILAGFDPEQPGRWHDDASDREGNPMLAIALSKIISEVRAAGIDIERHIPAKSRRKAAACSV